MATVGINWDATKNAFHSGLFIRYDRYKGSGFDLNTCITNQINELHQTLISNANWYISQAQANEVEQYFNAMMQAASWENLSQQVFKAVTSTIQSNIGELSGSNFYQRGTGALNAKGLAANQIWQALAVYKKTGNNQTTIKNALPGAQAILNSINSQADIEKLEIAARQLNGSLANVNGELFERFLATLGQYTHYLTEDVTEDAIEEVVSSIAGDTALNGAALSSGNLTRQFSITLGSDTNTLGILDSQQKVDASIPMIFSDGVAKELAISAKSMTKLRETSIVSGANMLALLSSMNFNRQNEFFMYNALTIYSGGGFTEESLQGFGNLIAMKAMIGLGPGGSGDAANVMVFYENDTKKVGKIRIISTVDFLKKSIDSHENFATLKWDPHAPPITEGNTETGARTAATLAAVQNLKVSVALNYSAMSSIFGHKW